MCCKRVKIGNHKEAIILLLHFHIISYRPEIITQMQEAGAPDATHHHIIGILHKEAKIRSWWFILRPMARLQFDLQHTDSASKARAGKITTDHGEIMTPIFMPVGTAGSVKAVSQQQLKDDV